MKNLEKKVCRLREVRFGQFFTFKGYPDEAEFYVFGRVFLEKGQVKILCKDSVGQFCLFDGLNFVEVNENA